MILFDDESKKKKMERRKVKSVGLYEFEYNEDDERDQVECKLKTPRGVKDT